MLATLARTGILIEMKKKKRRIFPHLDGRSEKESNGWRNHPRKQLFRITAPLPRIYTRNRAAKVISFFFSRMHSHDSGAPLLFPTPPPFTALGTHNTLWRHDQHGRANHHTSQLPTLSQPSSLSLLKERPFALRVACRSPAKQMADFDLNLCANPHVVGAGKVQRKAE